MKSFFLFITIIFSSLLFSQNVDNKTINIIKAKFEVAGDYYDKSDYTNALQKLKEIDELTNGQTLASVLNLKIKILVGLKKYSEAKKNLDQLYSMQLAPEIISDITNYEGKITKQIQLENERLEIKKKTEKERVQKFEMQDDITFSNALKLSQRDPLAGQEALESYLRIYKNGRHFKEAKQLLAKIKPAAEVERIKRLKEKKRIDDINNEIRVALFDFNQDNKYYRFKSKKLTKEGKSSIVIRKSGDFYSLFLYSKFTTRLGRIGSKNSTIKTFHNNLRTTLYPGLQIRMGRDSDTNRSWIAIYDLENDRYEDFNKVEKQKYIKYKNVYKEWSFKSNSNDKTLVGYYKKWYFYPIGYQGEKSKATNLKKAFGLLKRISGITFRDEHNGDQLY